MKYKTRVSRRINEVDLKSWDSVANICFLKSDVLEVVENLKLGKDSYYLEVFDGNVLVAIAVFYGQYEESLYYTIEEMLYGKFSKYTKFLLGLNPSLICFFPYSPFYEMYSINENYDKREVFGIISKELKLLAESGKYQSYAIFNVSSEELVLENEFLDSIFSGFKVSFDIYGESFEEYVKAIDKKSHRFTMKKDRRLFLEDGYKVEKIKNMDGYKEKIVDLFDANLEKYNDDNRKDLVNEFVEALDDKSERLTYFVSKKNGELISALMAIEDDFRVVALRVGQVESSDNEKGFPFYNVAIYEPLIYAIENSKKSLELGTGSYAYKVRRGAKLKDAYNLVKTTSRFKNMYFQYITWMLSKRNKKKHLSRLD